MTAERWHFPLDGAFSRMAGEERFHHLLRHGTMKVGVYAPRGADPQGPHQQDELYIVISGTGEFVKGKEG